MPSVVLEGDHGGKADADGAASQMKRKSVPANGLRLFRTRKIKGTKPRRLDESGPDELLDDWMVSAPAADPLSD
jgi:hypothetical protein